jgi:spectinomycin phosphotransferase
VRSPPTDLEPDRLCEELLDGWRLEVEWLEYVPEGGGGHHWKAVDRSGEAHFVTVDDLDNKDWMAESRERACDGLRRAFETAAKLRDEAGLDFVVAPVRDSDGRPLRRVEPRYTVSVFPFIAGETFTFGPHADPELRSRVTEMIVTLHQSTDTVRGIAPRHSLRFGGEREMRAFLVRPGERWLEGPFSEPARILFADQVGDLTRLVGGFDRLVLRTAPKRRRLVITHGEPHPANLISEGGRLHLIDWDTTALAAPERDLSLIATTEAAEQLELYKEATRYEVDADLITLYQLRWYVDDLGSAIRLFRGIHTDTADTRRWFEALPSRLDALPIWLDRLG